MIQRTTSDSSSSSSGTHQHTNTTLALAHNTQARRHSLAPTSYRTHELTHEQTHTHNESHRAATKEFYPVVESRQVTYSNNELVYSRAVSPDRRTIRTPYDASCVRPSVPLLTANRYPRPTNQPSRRPLPVGPILKTQHSPAHHADADPHSIRTLPPDSTTITKNTRPGSSATLPPIRK